MDGDELRLWRAWGPVAKLEGGVYPAGSTYPARASDPRVKADRSRDLGPLVAERQGGEEPSPLYVFEE